MMNTEQIRVPLVQPGTRPELAELEGRILAERGRISLLYQVLLNSEPIASGWERMLTAVRNQTSVSADLRELMILRVAVLNGAQFEFDAHIPHARAAGISAAKIAACRQPALSTEFSALETLVLELTDAMTRDIVVPGKLMDRLGEHFDPRGIVEVVATVAAYNMVSRLLVALNVACDVAKTDLTHVDGIDVSDIWWSPDGMWARMYGVGVPPASATGLTCLRSIQGASWLEKATYHYVVETDVAEQDEAEFNAWYEQEHLPGLARVPGTVLARRFRRNSGAPRYIACYDLTALATLEHPAWLEVRHTSWSSRVRPLFRNTRRTMFHAEQALAAG
jgi:4-carboxymuconolactone decarboxylase